MDQIRIGGYTYPASDALQFKLPIELREVSGLTLNHRGELFAHADERGLLYQIDYQAGRVLRRFALHGDVQADFEGIAWLDGYLYLTTSSGRIFRTRPGANGAEVPFDAFDAALDCEVESLTRHPMETTLLAACKNRPGGKKAVHIHAWNPADGKWSRTPVIRIERKALTGVFAAIGRTLPKKIQPTAMTTTGDGHLLIVAGPQKVLLELNTDGRPLAAAALDPEMHRQTEGIALTREGTLILADEGDNKGSNKSRGRLSIYEREG